MKNPKKRNKQQKPPKKINKNKESSKGVIEEQKQEAAVAYDVVKGDPNKAAASDVAKGDPKKAAASDVAKGDPKKAAASHVAKADPIKAATNTLEGLPIDLLACILNRLPPGDVHGLRKLSSPLRENVLKALQVGELHTLPAIPAAFIDRDHFFNLVTRRLGDSPKPLLAASQLCRGSYEGWLIVVDSIERKKGHLTVFFFNPLTAEKIILPSYLTITPPKNEIKKRSSRDSPPPCEVEKVVSSAHPSSYVSDSAGSANSSSYIAVLMDDFFHIAVYQHSTHSWTLIKSKVKFRDIEIINTRLYACPYVDSPPINLHVYDLKDLKQSPKAEVIISPPRHDHFDICYCFLAKDETLKELYLIYQWSSMLKILSFQLFKLGKTNESIGWQEVNLADRAIFICRFKSLVRSSIKPVGGNTVYYAYDITVPGSFHLNWARLRFGKFCMERRKSYLIKLKRWEQPYAPFLVWFVPCFW